MAYLDLTPFRSKVARNFNGLNFTIYGEIKTPVSKIITYFLTELACSMFSLDSCMSGLYFMHRELAKGMPILNAD